MIELLKIIVPNYLKFLLLKDNIYKNLLYLENLNNWEPDRSIEWFAVYENYNNIGLFAIRHIHTTCIDYHGACYKEFYSHKNKERLLEIIEKLKQRYKGYKIITTVPSNNKLALKINQKAGLKQVCKLDKACKNHDLIILEVI